MYDVILVASYIYIRYQNEYSSKIDEMKLHKLLYFSQRESIVRTNEPMFNAEFQAWKFGPVIVSVRSAYNNGELGKSNVRAFDFNKSFIQIMDYIFTEYAIKESWSLSRITHGEIAWINAREGIPEGENGYNCMKLEDIRKDAERIALHRLLAASANN